MPESTHKNLIIIENADQARLFTRYFKNLSQGLVEINNNSYISNLVYIESILRNNNEH